MRPIERKVFQKITDKGINFDDVLEILDGTSTQEMNKSFTDDCLFQSDKYYQFQSHLQLPRQLRLMQTQLLNPDLFACGHKASLALEQ